ncbi:hypothetical protein OAF42_02180 [Planctomicrobium sp.]|jgi:hypothetical protein|nr:hypothetical protein [Planctomicrobium sp.]MBT5020913.1 hypothetical protein [Planctomicrobium sp.]MDB4733229.1 hypothetical protein [Planctomicrobium sp.]
MILSRKMNLQLTPLLDLLLIVIFAQYLEVQETQETIEDNATSAIVERDVAVDALSEAEDKLQLVQKELDANLEQQRILADTIAELFKIPEKEIENILNSHRPPGVRTAADVERLKERFRQIAVEQSGRVVSHILTYEEIRKRCDIWDAHITPDNFLTLSSSDKTLKLQIPLDISEDFVQEEFIDQFIELAHTLPEPKSLVIALLSYERASQRWAVQGVREALPQIMLRLNFESAGRTRYDYAELGFRIE